MNPIENRCEILARAVYSTGRQFSEVTQLGTAFIADWNMVDLNILKNKSELMKKMILEVTRNHTGPINYLKLEVGLSSFRMGECEPVSYNFCQLAKARKPKEKNRQA